MKVRHVILGVLVLIVLAVHHVGIMDAVASGIDSESADAGVIVHGCCTWGWISNTNDFPVEVRWVHFEGQTDFTRMFQPGESLECQIAYKWTFQFYSADGQYIGEVKPITNG